MRQILLAAFLSASVLCVNAGTLPLYVNNTVVTNPQIDAAALLNNGTLNAVGTIPFDTANTRNYTNSLSGVMNGSPGFFFELITNGIRQPAVNFINRGRVEASTHVIVNATNITNAGSISTGPSGLVRLSGRSVNLARGGVGAGTADNSDFTTGFAGFDFYQNDGGITDLYWGSDTNNGLVSLNGRFDLPNGPTGPRHAVVVVPSRATNLVVVPRFPRSYEAHTFVITNFGREQVHVVFVPTDVDPLLKTSVGFYPGQFSDDNAAIVEFSADATDAVTGQTIQNSLYLIDNTMRIATNYGVSTNLDVPTFRPRPFELTRNTPFEWLFSQPQNFVYDNQILDNRNLTNRVPVIYHGYSAQLGGGYAFGAGNLTNPSNAPGRVEIEADSLDLSNARIRAQNTLSIRATNIISTTNLSLDAQFINYDLRSRAPTLTVDAFFSNSVVRLSGQIWVWSGYWINAHVTSPGVTNLSEFAVTIIDHDFVADQAVAYGSVYLKATNLVVGDSIRPVTSFTADATCLTITSNGLLSLPGSLGVAQLPSTRCLTNDGTILVSSVAYLGSDTAAPYSEIVNRGLLEAAYLQVRTTNLFHSGDIDSLTGPLDLQFGSALVSNGIFSAFGDLNIAGFSLDVAGAQWSSGAGLILSITNRLSDGGASNSFLVRDGFQFLVKPAVCDLLGSEIVSTAPQFVAVNHRSPFIDRGVSLAGYSNNGAIGRLVLDGGLFTVFNFSPLGASNALYVDYLELRNEATNYTSALAIDPGMTIYFAAASLPAEKLDGALGGRLRWVRNYTGKFSSTTITNADSSVIVVNTALRESSTIDSDADGIPNQFDPFPFDPIAVSLVLTPAPSSFVSSNDKVATITWQAAANTLYRIERKTSVNGTWQFLSNYTHGSQNGTAVVTDPITTNGVSFYRVLYFR